MKEENGRPKRKRKPKQPQVLTPSDYKDLPVSRIRGNKWNPRRTGFDGIRFDELVASIKQRGVIQPIVVRPIQEPEHDFEIIAGERRHRAMTIVAAENPKRSTIPAIVRDCDDEEAIEICFIENLQRQDLSEPEEARAFAEYVDKRGPDGVVVLAEKLGVSPRYVRKRVEIMRLPKPLIWAWQKEILQYGHLEQFLRIADKKDRLVILKQIIGGWKNDEEIPTVRDFRQSLDEASADLGRALFDKAGCMACAKNSETQRNLFGIGDDHAKCLDSRCYLARQKEWLSENWQSHLKVLDPEINTNGIRFSDEVTYADCEPFYYRHVPEKCLACENHVTVVGPSGDIRSRHSCCGRKECRRESFTSSRKDVSQPSALSQRSETGVDETEDSNGSPVKSWHGEHFREEFFKWRIPEKAKEYDPFHEKMIKLSLFAIVSSNTHVHRWYAERLDLPRKPRADEYGFFLHCKDIFPAIEALDPGQAVDLLKEAAIEVLLSNRTIIAGTRRRIAEFLGIDLASEWRITREYLEKKTKSEIVSIINRFKILDQPAAWKFAKESFGLKLRSAIGKLKKDQLMGIILETGIDLAGIVPAELVHDSTAGANAVCPNEQHHSNQRLAGQQISGDEATSYDPDPGYTVDPEEETKSVTLV